MPPFPLTNFEIQKYYQKKSKFSGVCSRNILTKLKYRAFLKIYILINTVKDFITIHMLLS